MGYIGQPPSNRIVTSSDLEDNVITSAKIADGVIIAGDLAANSVDSSELVDGSVDLSHMSSQSVDEDNLYISNAGSNGQYLSKQSGNNGGLTWATVDTTIANDSIVEAKLDVSNAPTNGYFLQAQSGEGGGLTWAAVDLSSKANLASPTFTGNPIAPTQSASNNSTRIATTAYVETAVSNLVDSSPSALNTLNELAAALGDDANFSTTVTNSIATKSPIASPNFTGGVGVISAKDLGSGIHIKIADSGGSVSTDAEQVVIERNVNSGMTILSGNNNQGNIYFGDDGDNDIGSIRYWHNGNALTFTTNASERMRIDSSGNVGIGEGTPFGKLHVKSADSGQGSAHVGANELVIENGGSGVDGDSGITILSGNTSSGAVKFGDSGNNQIGYLYYSHGDNSFGIGANGGTKLVIGASNQIGIGGLNWGSDGQVLTSGGSGAAVAWETAGVGLPSSSTAIGSIGLVRYWGDWNNNATTSSSNLNFRNCGGAGSTDLDVGTWRNTGGSTNTNSNEHAVTTAQRIS